MFALIVYDRNFQSMLIKFNSLLFTTHPLGDLRMKDNYQKVCKKENAHRKTLRDTCAESLANHNDKKQKQLCSISTHKRKNEKVTRIRRRLLILKKKITISPTLPCAYAWNFFFFPLLSNSISNDAILTHLRQRTSI